jgi:hypothetical protein
MALKDITAFEKQFGHQMSPAFKSGFKAVKRVKSGVVLGKYRTGEALRKASSIYKAARIQSAGKTGAALGKAGIAASKYSSKAVGKALSHPGILAGAMLSVGAALVAKKVYESKTGRTRVAGSATKKQSSGKGQDANINFTKEGHWITIRGGKRIFVQDKKGAAYTKAKAK